jgi:DNA-binding transcriptional LysR family regulator
MLNFNHLYYFHLAAVEGSAAGAAARLGVRQPTVSEQLKVLEQSLGVILFDRTKAGLTLTPAGRLAFAHTSVMFRESERLVVSLGGASKATTALRVGVSSAIARSTTTELLLPLIRSRDCVPSIRTGELAELMRALDANELDLVLCEVEPPITNAGVHRVVIDTTALVAVAPPSVSPTGDWSEVGMVHHHASSSYRRDADAFLSARRLSPYTVAESDSSHFLVETAIRGGFVTVVPRSVARDALATGALREIVAVDAAHPHIWAVCLDGTSQVCARDAIAALRTKQES